MKAYRSIPIPNNRVVQESMLDAMQFTAETLMDKILSEPYTNELTVEKDCLSRLLTALLGLYMNRRRPRERKPSPR